MNNITFHSPPDYADMRPRITVIGVGGAGGNAVNNMIRSELQGVDFLVANTDAQALELSDAPHRIRLGATLTNGLGAGAEPEIGRAAAEETLDDLMTEIDGSNMIFIAAGMGGGTGTGAAPVIARAARERGMLTVGVVTKPFNFEGTKRMRMAEDGIDELAKFVDTLIVIPNQNLFQVADARTGFAEAFQMVDEVLWFGIRGVTDLMTRPGLINLDFKDIRKVMGEMGKAMMGTGEAEGEKKAIDAAEAAIDNPLLDDTTMRGAQALLINITGGLDMGLMEVDEAANRIRKEVDEDAEVIFGATLDENMNGKMRVSVVATGIDSQLRRTTQPAACAVKTREQAPADGALEAPAEEAPVQEAAVQEAAAVASPEEAPLPEAMPIAAAQTDARQEAPDAEPAAVETPGPAQVRGRNKTIRRTATPDKPIRVVKTSPLSVPPTAAPKPAVEADPARGRWFGLPGLLRKKTENAAEEPSVLELSIGSGSAVPAPPEDDAQLDIPAFLKQQAN